MAEYNMTYDELKGFVENCIANSESKPRLTEYKAVILAALTANANNNNPSEMKDMLSLWENQTGRPSELLLGTHYIRIKDSMLAFIEAACSSGLVDALIGPNSVSGITVAVASGVAHSLVKLFASVSKLGDMDFCIYMQAVCHFKAHKPFSKDDLLDWFPHGGNLTCNMHNSKWDCDFFENDKCSILADGGLDKALVSLIEKNLLKKCKNKQYFYEFPY